jgi:hypothetical protein
MPGHESAISCRRCGFATDGPARTASTNPWFATRPTGRTPSRSPRTTRSAHGSSSQAPQAGRQRSCFAKTRAMSRNSSAAPPARDVPGRAMGLGGAFIQTQADRIREADEYYAALRPEGTSDEEAMVMRQAFAGMTWSLQSYHYDVARWLEGDRCRPLKRGGPAAISAGATSTITTSSRCPIRVNTLGMLRGTSLSTAWFSPTPARRCRRANSSSSLAKGTWIPTDNCRPTNGTSTM